MNKVEKELDQLIKAYKDYTYNSENPIVVLESFICDLEEIKEMVKSERPNVQGLIERCCNLKSIFECEINGYGSNENLHNGINILAKIHENLRSIQPQEVKTHTLEELGWKFDEGDKNVSVYENGYGAKVILYHYEDQCPSYKRQGGHCELDYQLHKAIELKMIELGVW